MVGGLLRPPVHLGSIALLSLSPLLSNHHSWQLLSRYYESIGFILSSWLQFLSFVQLVSSFNSLFIVVGFLTKIVVGHKQEKKITVFSKVTGVERFNTPNETGQ